MSLSRASVDGRYGAWKRLHEIGRGDLVRHPIWVWCSQVDQSEADGPIGGDETAMRPVLDVAEVPMDHRAPPLILLEVLGTHLLASGLLDVRSQILSAIAILSDSGAVSPSRFKGLPEPTVYVSVPLIDGVAGALFRAEVAGADRACRLASP